MPRAEKKLLLLEAARSVTTMLSQLVEEMLRLQVAILLPGLAVDSRRLIMAMVLPVLLLRLVEELLFPRAGSGPGLLLAVIEVVL